MDSPHPMQEQEEEEIRENFERKLENRKDGPINIPKATLKRMYTEEKKSLQEIARHFGVVHSTIHYKLKHLDINRRHEGWRKLSPQDEKLLVQAYVRDRVPTHILTEQYDVSTATVVKTVRRYGYPVASPGSRLSRAQEDIIHQGLEEGLSPYQIARQARCCLATVYKRRKQREENE